MRKIILPALFLLCISNTFSQITDTSLTEQYQNGEWQNSYRNITAYDGICNIQNILTQSWDIATGTWINSGQSTYKYDDMGRVAAMFFRNWDIASGTWVSSAKGEYNYQNNGLQQFFTYQLWDAVTKTWTNNYRSVSGLNSAGYTVKNEFDLFMNNEWMKISKTIITYDAKLRPVESISQTWANEQWTNSNRTLQSYTGNGLSVGYYWDSYNQQWIKSSRSFNDYLDQTSYTEKTVSQSNNGGTWVNSTYQQNTYNENNMPKGYNFRVWDADSQSWLQILRSLQQFYSNGNPSVYTMQLWDNLTGTWTNNHRYTHSNSNCPLQATFTPVVQDKSVKNNSAAAKTPGWKTDFRKVASMGQTLLSATQFDINEQSLIYNINVRAPNNTGAYSFQMILSPQRKNSTGAASEETLTVTKKSFVISPNPAKNYFIINISSNGNSTLSMNDVSGRLVLQKKMQPGMQKVDLPSLQKGLYIITVTTGKEILKQKLVIE